mmetsp:Transcript_40167/g.64751  ORF Transcript_40167/g.64751 Transcript_40167/m.64751 type:complete len:122 (-) Transcript_40167:205-570(-)
MNTLTKYDTYFLVPSFRTYALSPPLDQPVLLLSLPTFTSAACVASQECGVRLIVRGASELVITAQPSLPLHGTTVLREHCGHLCMNSVFSTHDWWKGFEEHCEQRNMAASPRTDCEQMTYL